MMKHLAVGLALVGLPACSNGNTPAHGDAVLAIRTTPLDFAVGLDNAAPADPPGPTPRPMHDVVGVGWIGTLTEATADELEVYLREHAFLVSLGTEARVEGRFEPGWTLLSGAASPDNPFEGIGSSFRPSAGPLPDGWYVLGLDLSEWLAAHPSPEPAIGGYPIGGSTFTRFHVGPTTTWVRSYVHCGELDSGTRGCLVAPILTAPPPDGANPFSLMIDGAVDPACEERREPGAGWFWRCPLYADGTVISIHLVGRDRIEALGGLTNHLLELASSGETEFLVAPDFGIDVARRVL